MPEPVTIYQEWRCERCQAKGCVEGKSSHDAAWFAREAMEEHRALSAGCTHLITFAGEWTRIKPANVGA